MPPRAPTKQRKLKDDKVPARLYDDAEVTSMDVEAWTSEMADYSIAALRDEQKTERTATREQLRAARENGETIDRAALREQAREARTDHRIAMADIFTDDQQEIIQIHRILAQGAAKQMLQQRRGDGERRQGRRGMRRGR